MKRTLYLGTHPASYPAEGDLIHYPVIKLIPRPIPPHILEDMPEYTHFIFTSKNAVAIFFQTIESQLQNSMLPILIGKVDLKEKTIIAIGKSTASRLVLEGCQPTHVAQEETQEGIISLLRPMDLREAYILLPHSSLARHALENFFSEHGIRHQICDLYDTITQKIEPVPDLDTIDEIVFTSPSTVRAFVEIFSHIPHNKKLTCLGPITKEELTRSFR